MNVGTKSLLWGVHQVVWHPITVALAWRQIEGRWPNWWQSVAIVLHDVGYWGCPNMDGEEGRQHPVRGAEITANVVQTLYATAMRLRYPIQVRVNEAFAHECFIQSMLLRSKAYKLALGHSRFFAEKERIQVSKLFRPDKLCVRFDPPWFYLLRARLSGELAEYVNNSTLGGDTGHAWYQNYRYYVNKKFGGRCE